MPKHNNCHSRREFLQATSAGAAGMVLAGRARAESTSLLAGSESNAESSAGEHTMVWLVRLDPADRSSTDAPRPSASGRTTVLRESITEAVRLAATGCPAGRRPSLGSRIAVALGSIHNALPPFVVLTGPSGVGVGDRACWNAGRFPSAFEGVAIDVDGDALSITTEASRFDASLDSGGDLVAAVDWTCESRTTREQYGIDRTSESALARKCLSARRLIERGVRVVQIHHQPEPPQAERIGPGRQSSSDSRDVATTLVRDLFERGMLDRTLVVATEIVHGSSSTPDADAGEGRSVTMTSWMTGGCPGALPMLQTEVAHCSAGTRSVVSIDELHVEFLQRSGLSANAGTLQFA